MTERLEKIFSVIPKCKVFSDVGCDHGYIAKKMLKSGKCEKAYISDISPKSLEKAEKLLEEYMGKSAFSFVSDGLDNVPPSDCVLIAGMGGEETVKILSRAKTLPENLILQPMRNLDKVRLTLLDRGYKILSDEVFYSKKIYYDLISAKKGKDFLTCDEILFGRTNIIERSEVFKKRLNELLFKAKRDLSRARTDEKREKELIDLIEKMEKYV